MAQLGTDGIVYVEPIGDQTFDTVKELEKELALIVEQLNVENRPVHIFIDFGKMGVHTSGARRAAFDFLNSSEYEKLAISCQGLLLKYTALYILKASQKVLPVKYVVNRDEAIHWFSQESW